MHKTTTPTRPESRAAEREPTYADLLAANEAMGQRIDELEAQLVGPVDPESAWPSLSGRYWPVSS